LYSPGWFAEQHRELVRRCLRLILTAGYSPMSFFARDYAKYFYLAELLSLVDLSLVSKEGGVLQHIMGTV
jgi:acyl-CoA oxidase